MNTRFTWGKLLVVTLVVGASYAQAAIKMSGHTEGGALFQAIKGGASDFGFMVDHIGLKTEADVSNKLSFVMTKEIAFNSGSTAAAAGANTSFYFNKLGAVAPAAGARLFFNVNEAYVAHKCSESVTFKFGMISTPFSMEGMTHRYGSSNYMMSAGYNMAVTNGWNYDLGVMASIGKPIPGTLEVAIMDGRVASAAALGAAKNTSFAARWHTSFDAGSLTLEPVVSTYVGQLNSGPNDFGLSGGLKLATGPFALNAEFIRSSTGAAALGHTRSLWFEPSFDAGVALLSAKLDLARSAAGANSTHLGVTVSKQYDDWRARLAYTLGNLSGAAATTHDIRVLLGTTF